jgi:hypothetical protein
LPSDAGARRDRRQSSQLVEERIEDVLKVSGGIPDGRGRSVARPSAPKEINPCRTMAPHTFACWSRWLREPLRDWSVSKNAGSTTSARELNNLSRTKLSFGWWMTAKQAFMAAFAILSISDNFIALKL